MNSDVTLDAQMIPAAATDQPATAANAVVNKPNRTRPLLAGAALTLSAVSIGLHFLPVIADHVQVPPRAQPWLQRVESAMVNRNMRGALTSDDLARATDAAKAFEALPADAQKAFRLAADMEQSVARLDALHAELEQLKRQSAENEAARERLAATAAESERRIAAQGLDMLTLRGPLDARLDALSSRLDQNDQRLSDAASRGDVAKALAQVDAQIAEMKAGVQAAQAQEERLKKVEQQTSDLAQTRSGRDTVQLLLGRVLSAAQSGPVDARELDMLAQLTAQDPPLAKKVAELKTLAGLAIPPIFVLRDQFRALQPRAVELARTDGLSRIAGAIAAVRNTLHAWGMSSTYEPAVGELAIENASDALDHGDLAKALFELEAVPPQTRRFLAVWGNQVKLRLSLDRLFSTLIDHLASQPELFSNKS